MAEYRDYTLLGARHGRSDPDDHIDEYLWLVYAPDGRLVGDRWTYKGACALVDELLAHKADDDGVT